MENENAFKHLFGQELLKRIAGAIGEVNKTFDQKAFQSLISKLKPLEMKPRVYLIRDELRRQLPDDFPKALQILMKSFRLKKLDGFDLWPYTEFVQTYGLEHRDLSLRALRELTKVFTAEWAVRPFLKWETKPTLKFLEACAREHDVHLRRWASEGSRPRLPWGERLTDFVNDPSPTLPILELLKFDSELYVRKSVANHLNDIGKDHPEYVMKLLAKWQKQAGAEHAEKIKWTIKHALRSLIKAGNPEALSLIGVSSNAKVKMGPLCLQKKNFKVGETLHFEFKLQSLSAKPQKLVIDYLIHFARANSKRSAKVFKLKNLVLEANDTLTLSKNHSLKEVTTRKHYSGTHFLEIQINGKIMKRVAWELR